MLKTSDVQLVNGALGDLGDTLLKNRMMKQEQDRFAQEQQRLTQQNDELSKYRTATLDERTSRDKDMADIQNSLMDIRAQRANTAQQNADTAKSKGGKVFYFVSPSTKNVMSFTGTPAEAQTQFEKIQASKPGEKMAMTDKEPESLKDLNEIPIDDQHTLHASDADAAKYYSQKAEIASRAAKPPAQAAPKQEIRQVINPARVVQGEVNTNEPPYLSLTNTTTPLNIGGSDLRNLAPAASPAAATPAAGKAKPLTADIARQYLQQAGGDKDKARALAKQAGYDF